MIRKSRTSLFLMEIIISILLFSLTAAVCVQLFVQTHLKEKQASELQFAMVEVGNINSIIKNADYSSVDDIIQGMKNYYSDCVIKTHDISTSDIKPVSDSIDSETDFTINISFNSAYKPCPMNDEQEEYICEITLTFNEKMLTCDFNIHPTNSDESIYSTIIKRYLSADISAER